MESKSLAVLVTFVVTIGKLLEGTMKSFGFGSVEHRFDSFGYFTGSVIVSFGSRYIGDPIW